MINRDLYKIQLQTDRFEKSTIDILNAEVAKKLNIPEHEANYFVFQKNVVNDAYNPKMDKINILLKNNTISDISEAADTFNIKALATPVKKWFLCYPKH